MWTALDRCSSRGVEQPSSNHNVVAANQQETLPDVERISTIAGSLVSIASISQIQVRYCTNDPGYDTEHTSLDSDFDEAELRRQLLRDKWKLLFDMNAFRLNFLRVYKGHFLIAVSSLFFHLKRTYYQAVHKLRSCVALTFDPEGFGEIPVDDFVSALKSPEFLSQVPMNKRELLHERAKLSKLPTGPGYVTFQDFVNVMSGKRSRSFKCAVHQRDREVCSENDFHLVVDEPAFFKKMVHVVAMEVLPEERDRKYYADRYTCCPPPFFIVLMTVIELSFFAYHTLSVGDAQPAGPVPIDSLFIYRPDKRHEIWRFLFYVVLHAGWFHLGFNLCIQLLFGLPLEMVHGCGRIACVYFAGVLAGSLGTSVFDPEVYLVGASGGVYALLAAHLANVMINFHQMRYGVLRLLAILAFASCDVGFAVYARYSGEHPFSRSVSYVAHLTGALAGLTIGLLVLKNFEQKLHEQLLWWVALGIYTACIFFAVTFNVLNSNVLQGLKVEVINATETVYHDFQL